MEEDIYSPSAEEFRLALIAFVLVASSVAFHRGRESGPRRMAYIAKHLANEFKERLTTKDAEEAIGSVANDSRRTLGALFEELIYIACKYNKSAREAGIELTIPGNTTVFDGEIGNVFSDEAIDDIETVKGSISWLLEKLPKWAQRIIEVLLEALKLTKGG